MIAHFAHLNISPVLAKLLDVADEQLRLMLPTFTIFAIATCGLLHGEDLGPPEDAGPPDAPRT